MVGLELEYGVVDARLRPRCVVESAFRTLRGRPTSDVEYRGAGFSNELAAHVFEVKTLRPQRSLRRAEQVLMAGLRRFAEVLDRDHGARLLPAGMHPFMRPADTRLWPRAGRRIYRAYDRVFGIREHGWLNVQACHVNLPFGTEPQTVALHNATASLLPYLPALAASSPIYEGRIGPFVDNRLAFYRVNQRRVPAITGRVIPEFVSSYGDYRRSILRRMYRDLTGVPGAEILRHEWLNSRGAIVRFMRSALEIRVLDMQECVRADVAVAAFVRGALRRMTRDLLQGRLRLPDHTALVHDFDSAVRDGRRARVTAAHLGRLRRTGSPTAQDALRRLLPWAHDELPAAERGYLEVVADRIERGSLSERIRRAVRRGGGRTANRRRRVITRIYEELAECLRENVVWPG